jgi:hypothetical protein
MSSFSSATQLDTSELFVSRGTDRGGTKAYPVCRRDFVGFTLMESTTFTEGLLVDRKRGELLKRDAYATFRCASFARVGGGFERSVSLFPLPSHGSYAMSSLLAPEIDLLPDLSRIANLRS